MYRVFRLVNNEWKVITILLGKERTEEVLCKMFKWDTASLDNNGTVSYIKKEVPYFMPAPWLKWEKD
jgi:hypothetical protein